MMKITKVIVECHRLDKDMQRLLSKEQVLEYAQSLIQIVEKHTEPEQLRLIVAELQDLFGKED